MNIEAHPPFRITRDADDAWHAIRDNIQVTVTANVGEATVKHVVGVQPQPGRESRWLQVRIPEPKGPVHVMVHGTHVLVTGTDYSPTFDLASPQELMDRAVLAMRAGKDEKGRPIVDTEANRTILQQLVDRVAMEERNRLMAWMKNASARLAAE